MCDARVLFAGSRGPGAGTAAAVSAAQGGGRAVLPGPGQAAVRQPTPGLQRLSRHHEGVQVTNVS